jgi:hypothetical protein
MQGSHEKSGFSFWFHHDDEAFWRGRETFSLFFSGLPYAFSVTSMLSNIFSETRRFLGPPNLHTCNELTDSHVIYKINLC